MANGRGAKGKPKPPLVEDELKWREQKADTFLKYEPSDGHVGWYDSKANSCKRWHFWTSLMIIAAGAATSVIQLWAPQDEPNAVDPITIATAVLGALVILVKGWQELANWYENWLSYRKAAELLKRETRLFTNNAGVYADLDTQDSAYRVFVERCEAVIAEEQKQFFGRQEEEAKD